jgi:hypothetical protein
VLSIENHDYTCENGYSGYTDPFVISPIAGGDAFLLIGGI